MWFNKSRTGILVSAPRGALEPCLDFQTIEIESGDIRNPAEKSLFVVSFGCGEFTAFRSEEQFCSDSQYPVIRVTPHVSVRMKVASSESPPISQYPYVSYIDGKRRLIELFR